MSQLKFESCSVLIEGLEYSSVSLMVMFMRALEWLVLFSPSAGTMLRGL